METKRNVKLDIDLEDVRDWALCPLRIWWRKTGLASDVANLGGKNTGERLVRESIFSAINIYYRTVRNSPDFTFGESLGLVWKSWLETWGLSSILTKPLLDYQKMRRSMLSRFEEGAITNRDGEKYKRPMWTRYWHDMAETSGLSALRRKIDSHQVKMGMASMDLPDKDYYQAPIGLADAFSNSIDIERSIKLPSPKGVLGVQVPMFVELPSVNLKFRVDIVRENGKSNRVGRPSDDETKSSSIRKLECIILLFEETLPSIYSLAKDLRVISYGQGELVTNDDTQPSKVDNVLVFHLPSGESQEFKPRLGDGAEMLGSISRSVITGIRGGVYVPRMICGWKACGDCEYRKLCFSDPDVMDAFNPPLMSQINSSMTFYDNLTKFINGKTSSIRKVDVVRSLVEFMAKSPSITPEGVLWMLDHIEAEQQ